MSVLNIPDDVLKRAGITDDEAMLELACRLFSTGKLTLFFAAKLAGMTGQAFEDALLERGLPIHRYDGDDLQNDLQTLGSTGP